MADLVYLAVIIALAVTVAIEPLRCTWPGPHYGCSELGVPPAAPAGELTSSGGAAFHAIHRPGSNRDLGGRCPTPQAANPASG